MKGVDICMLVSKLAFKTHKHLCITLSSSKNTEATLSDLTG